MRTTFLFTAAAVLLGLNACKKDEATPEDTTYSGSFRYNGGDYTAVQADFREKTYSVVNPDFGKPGEPAMIDVPGFEVNLWSHPAGQAILLNFQVKGRSVGRYAAGQTKPQGFALNVFENGNVLKRSAQGNGDTSWIEITRVDTGNKLISGKFYSLDKAYMSAGSDYYAVTKGEFRNVRQP